MRESKLPILCKKCHNELEVEIVRDDAHNLFPWIPKGKKMIDKHIMKPCIWCSVKTPHNIQL